MARREVYEELPSTQDRAVELARAGAGEGSVVVARRQTRGRGRGDRRWVSPAGGLYLSVVLGAAEDPELLPLAIGSELAGALGEAYAVRLRLKWPNDLLWVDPAGDARKLAGILTDLVRTDGEGRSAVAGIGVNAARPGTPWPPDVQGRAVALEEIARSPVDLLSLERVVVDAALRARRAVTSGNGLPFVLARARGLLYGVGEAVSRDGRPVGTVIGLGPEGTLRVQGAAGVEEIRVGDVRWGVGA